MTIQDISVALAAKKITSVELVKQAIAAATTHREKNAIGVISPLALQIAKERDDERSRGTLRGVLHGIPIVIKDNLLYQDGTPTTANSYALRDLMPPFNATVVDRLIDAGAILVGKANMSEMANFLTDHLPNGFGSMYGQVLHPFDVAIDPLGSSTGSAVAVALGIVPAAIGTETNGSLLGPAYFNQVVTLKPSPGRVPQTGIIPISPSQDTAGPFATSVKDVALIMDVIAAAPGAFTTKLSQPPKGTVLYLTMEGWLDDWVTPAWIEAIKPQVMKRLTMLGVTVEERVITPESIDNGALLLSEFKPAIDAFLQSLGPAAPVTSMEELIAEYRRHPERAMTHGISLLEASLTHAKAVDDPDYLALKRDQQAQASWAERTLDEGYLAIVTTAWTDWGAIYGNPSVQVPEKTWQDHPRGVTFIGKKGEDDSVLALAHQYEQLLR
jgi:amidase